jgi:protein O-mannosyl-transferase
MRVNFLFFLILPVFFAIAVVLHHPGFSAPMIYDSVGFIKEYEYVFASGDLAAVIGIVPARPLFMLTLSLNYALTGMEPYGFRLCNAFVLAGASTVLVLLSVLVWELPGLSLPGTTVTKRVIALFTGLLFLVHPLQGLTVLYIWQREAIMACFFFFSALAVYLAGRSGRWIRPIPAYIATALFFFAGILSKENVISLPIVLVLAEIVLLRGAHRCALDLPSCDRDPLATPHVSIGLREIVKRISIIAAITVPPFLIAQVLVYHFHGPDAGHSQGVVNRLVQYYRGADLTPIEVALTECRVAFWYLLTMVAPFRSGIEIIAPCVISRSLWSPPVTVAGVAGVVTLAALGLALMRRHPVPSFAILFFLITLAPESLLIPQYLFCGYRAVLPLAGVLLGFGAVLLGFSAQSESRGPKIATLVILMGITMGLALMTRAQAQRWNPSFLWTKAYNALPPYAKDIEATPYLDILGSYALELRNEGNYDASVDVLDRLIRIDSPPNNFKKTLALANKGVAQIKKGDKQQGLETLKEAFRFDPSDAWACYQLADALLDQGHREEGLQTLKKAVELNPRYLPSRLRLAHLLRESGQFEDAIGLFQEAAKLNPHSAAIQNALGAAQEQAGKQDQALASFKNAVNWEPQSADHHFNLAKCLAQMSNVPDAIKHFQRAVELNPALGPAHANLGSLLLRSGRAGEALISFEKALALLPANAELHFQAAVALISLGRSAEAREHLEKALALNPLHAKALQNLERIITGAEMPASRR